MYDYWDWEYGYGTTYLMPKADQRVDYRQGGTQENRCYDCRYYLYGACALVEGVIEASWVCNLYTNPPEVFPRASDESGALAACEITQVAAKGRPWRLFTELPAPLTAAEPPDWIPLMPVPGLYRHPTFGEINLTQDRNERFVQNFNQAVYQSQVALDAEHESKLSGAVAWMDELRLNEDGSVDAHIKEWTPRGQAFMANDAYKYISPEWYEIWQDPATGTVYADIICGAALTNQPFFKEGSLRPLVASTRGISIGWMNPTAPGSVPETKTETTVRFRELSRLPTKAQEESKVMSVNPNAPRNDPAAAPAPAPAAASAVVTPQQFNELERRFGELSERFTTTANELATTRQANETLTGQLEQATTNIATMQASERSRRFAEMAMGRGGANDGGHPWIGEVADHVAVLEALAATEATEDGPFQRYVRTQRAAAEQTHMSSQLAASAPGTRLTTEVGSAALSRTSGSARSEADGLIKTMREKDPKLTIAMAEQQLWEANGELYTRVRDEEKRYARENRTS
jgi:hypothetical protein